MIQMKKKKSWKLVISAGSTRMPLTGMSLKLKSLDPSNCDSDEEEEELEVGDFCRFRQNALDRNVFEGSH